MGNIKDNTVRKLIKIYQKIPLKPFRKQIGETFKNYRDKNKNRIVTVKINGINYELDLNETVDSLVYYGNFEVELTKRFKENVKKNMFCIDIGANMGYYTLMLANLVGEGGKVIAFEPMDTFTKLKKNVELNKFDNIVLEKKALSDTSQNKQKVTFRSHYPLDGKEVKELEEVDFISLDDYITKKGINKLDFIKIDVDGFESKVINGALKTIEKFKPIIIIEMGFFENQQKKELFDIISFLKTHYNFYSENNKFLEESKVINEIEKLTLGGTLNFLLRPKK